MGRNLILILEDNDERIQGFKAAVASLGNGIQVILWNDAPTMITECPAKFAQTCLISLDHDLNPMPGVTTDPGTGMDIAVILSKHQPFCPVVLHSSNYERMWSMHNELRHAGWIVDRVGPIGENWIQTMWLNKVRNLLGNGTEIE